MNYYDTTMKSCMSKKDEYVPCASSIECLGTMPCTSGQCQCAFDSYFELSSFSCVARTLNNTACLTNNTCRVDLGLSCQNNYCQCDLTAKFWLGSLGQCSPFLTLNQTGCTIDANCISSQKLSCIAGKCDCLAVFGNETYWDSLASVCQPCQSYGATCSANNTCCALTEYLFCSGGLCSLRQLGEICSLNAQCDANQTLVCSSGTCQCAITHYASGSICGIFFKIVVLFFLI